MESTRLGVIELQAMVHTIIFVWGWGSQASSFYTAVSGSVAGICGLLTEARCLYINCYSKAVKR